MSIISAALISGLSTLACDKYAIIGLAIPRMTSDDEAAAAAASDDEVAAVASVSASARAVASPALSSAPHSQSWSSSAAS